VIKYDYSLRRSINETEFKVFVPDKIPSELPNLVLIEGPNSSGKSTLLNILAMSLYGDKSTKLNPELLEKISSLKFSLHQKIVFDFEITDRNGNKVLESVKGSYDDEDVILCEYVKGKKKPLSYRSFLSKYNLIYDIPSKPTERLRELLNELKDEQLRYGTKIKHITDFVSVKLNELENYRDPERIADYETKITECEDEITGLENKLPTLKEFYNNLENYTYLRQYLYYHSELDTLVNRLSVLKKRKVSTKKRVKSVNRKYRKTKRDTSGLMDTLSNDKRTITPLLKKLFIKDSKEELQIWADINLFNMKDNMLDPKLEFLANKFANKIVNMMKNIQDDEAFINGRVYDNLIGILEQYRNVNITIPKIDVTINEILNIMIEEKEKYEEIIDGYNNLSDILADLESIDESLDKLKKYLVELSKMEETESDIIEGDYIYDDSIDQDISSIEKEIKNTKKQHSFYHKQCISKDINVELDQFNLKDLFNQFEENKNLKPYFAYKETTLLNRINGMNEQIKKMDEDINHQNNLKEIYQDELTALISMEIHPYEGYKDELNIILPRLRTLSSLLLGKYNEMINNLIKKDLKKIKKGDDVYHQNIFKYLGNRIGKFRHIERDYEATEIDLINGVIKTRENITIHLIDMGTGQSQSAFLLGLLNTPDDKRKIIALFDEVAMMDRFALKPVYDCLRELYNQDRLLLSVVIQRGDEIKVRDLLE